MTNPVALPPSVSSLGYCARCLGAAKLHAAVTLIGGEGRCVRCALLALYPNDSGARETAADNLASAAAREPTVPSRIR